MFICNLKVLDLSDIHKLAEGITAMLQCLSYCIWHIDASQKHQYVEFYSRLWFTLAVSGRKSDDYDA